MSEKMEPRPEFKILLRNFLIELLVYGVLIVIYFLLVLRFMSGYLSQLFDSNLVTYAVVALLVIVTQSVALDYVTSFLLDQIKLKRLE